MFFDITNAKQFVIVLKTTAIFIFFKQGEQKGTRKSNIKKIKSVYYVECLLFIFFMDKNSVG